MLPQLVENSSKRLKESVNFQSFLRIAQNKRVNKSSLSSVPDLDQKNIGSEDLQMQEALEIVKDMAFLNSLRELSYN